MNFEIVTDSSANLTDTQIEKYGVTIVSLVFRVGEKEFFSYIKGEKTDIKQYYDMMRNGETLTTAQMSYEYCKEAFEEILSKGKDVLHIGFSSGLSGSYQVAMLVAEEMRGLYPERTILTVDSLAASMGQGLLIHYAYEQKKAGKSMQDIHDWLVENRLNLCHWFTVDDLHFLKRGGRISATTAIAGTILGIKPIMHVDNEGKLVPTGKVRGRKASLEALIKEMEKTALNPSEQTIFISHGDCIEDAQYVEKLVKEKFKTKHVVINYVDPVIGAHSGPGTIALFFLGTQR